MAEQPSGIFVGLPIARVQSIQEAHLAALEKVKIITSGSSGGNSFSSQFPTMTLEKVLIECAYALRMMSGDMVRRVQLNFNRRSATADPYYGR